MGRLVAHADIVLDPLAVEAMISAAEDGESAVLVNGVRVDDEEGAYYEVSGRGDPVGMSVTSAEGGTAPGDGALEMFRERFSEGVLVMVDPYAGEFALYIVDGDGVRQATAVMSERCHTQMACLLLMSSSVLPVRDMSSLTTQSKNRRDEFSNIVPRGATLLRSSPCGTSRTTDVSETFVRGLPGVPVMQMILDPIFLAICAV